MQVFFTLMLSFITVAASADTQPDVYLDVFLKKFQQDPAQVMNLVPPKYNSAGQRIAVRRNIPIEVKDRERQTLCKEARPGESCRPHMLSPMAEISGDSDLRNFFYSERVQTGLEESSGQVATKLSHQPWSGDYWATYKLGIAARYNDPNYPAANDFKDYFNYVKKNWNLDLTDVNQVRQLSPSEKYDLLMGLQDRPLTSTVLGEANDTYRANGNKIEKWFGICHGWAPASFMMGRPRRAVEVQSLIPQLKILFYPDDIKALASHLWANATLQSRVMGGRCDDKTPKRDENGRVISENCYDVNPGSWHLAVFNQLTLKEKSFVIDATYDYEVWNQPVVAYKMTFFNPETRERSKTFEKSMIERSQFKKDPFTKYRSDQAAFFVGVSMELTYMTENQGSNQTINDESYDQLQTVQYIYDLEVNAKGQIIGGEWYQNAHPDFLWAPSDKARAISVVERELSGTWKGPQAPPAEWSQKAAFAATYSQPLALVIENLIRLAQ